MEGCIARTSIRQRQTMKPYLQAVLKVVQHGRVNALATIKYNGNQHLQNDTETMDKLIVSMTRWCAAGNEAERIDVELAQRSTRETPATHF